MKITYENKQIEVETGSKIKDIFKYEIKGQNIIACKINNDVKSLNYELNEEVTVELLDITDKDGMMIYIRGLLFIMGAAFAKLYPEAELNVNYQLHNSMFCEVKNIQITEEILNDIEKEMRKIVSQNIEITKISMTKQEAEEFYKKEKTEYGKL